MKVKELINELLECDMNAEVTVLVEMRRDLMAERLNQDNYTYAVDDDANIVRVHDLSRDYARIILEDAEKWR